MPRITPIADKSEVAPEYHNVVDGVLEVFGSIRGPHSILLHRPQLDAQALALGNFFRYDSVVKSPERELAVITAALATLGPTLIIFPFSFGLLVFLTAFEVLVEFLQAYIFTILAAVYIADAMHPAH